jgi:hypothetical protein
MAALDFISTQTIFSEIQASIADIGADRFGRKVLIYALNHRSPVHFAPSLLEIFKEGDSNPFSKKDPATRQAEILSAVSPIALSLVRDHAADLAKDGPGGLFAFEALTRAEGERGEACAALARVSCEDGSPIFADAMGHRVIKKLIAHEAEQGPLCGDEGFAGLVLEAIQDAEGGLAVALESNRAAFVILKLLECRAIPTVAKRVTDALSKHKKALAGLDHKGAQLIREQLEGGAGDKGSKMSKTPKSKKKAQADDLASPTVSVCVG